MPPRHRLAPSAARLSRLRTTLAAAMALALTVGAAQALETACQGKDLLAELAPEARQALNAELAAIPYASGNIWRAEAPDGTKLTVVGTMHLADPRQEEQMRQIGPLLDAASLLVVEADPATERELLARMAAKPDLAFITSGPSLLELIGPEDWPRLKEALAERGVPGVMAAKFQPWYAMLTLSVPACIAASLKTGGAMGLDRQLIEKAVAQQIAMAPLEDLDLLMNSMIHGTTEEQIESLKLALRTDLSSPDMIATMLNAYFAGNHRESWSFWRYLELDLTEGDRISVEAEMQYMERALLEERNLNWIGKILTTTKGKTAVVAVGAAHLSDWHGLLNQLAEKGFSLTRLDG